MFKKLLCISLIAFNVSCKKTVTPVPNNPTEEVEMEYLLLNDQEVKPFQDGVMIDLNRDQKPDLLFYVMLVGDHIQKQDRFHYNVLSSIRTSILVNSQEQTPSFLKGTTIPISNFDGHAWYPASEITLIEKRVHENSSITWHGNWLTAERAYLPVTLSINNQVHGGWVELSSDPVNGKIILHRAAITKRPNKLPRAGI